MCNYLGCENPVKTAGYCGKHYQQLHRKGLLTKIYNGRKKCEIPGCKRFNSSDGLCYVHKRHLDLYGDALAGKFYTKFERHNSSYKRVYKIYRGMLNRCFLVTSSSYKDYGERGISVCDRWRESFSSFLEDMGECPSPTHQLDRIDNNKGYSAENCVWATPAENSRHKRNTKLNKEIVKTIRDLVSTGLTATQIGKKLNVNVNTCQSVIKNRSWADKNP
jgi:hypothetical protein